MDLSDDSLIFRNAYCCSRHCRCDMLVREKIQTDVRGHMTYVLVGVATDDEKIKFSTLVNRSQWERYDVPIQNREVVRKVNRKRDMEVSMNKYEEPSLPPKSRRRSTNAEIERWLAEHYGIDLDSLDGMDGSIFEDDGDSDGRNENDAQK